MFATTEGRAANPWTISASLSLQLVLISSAIIAPMWRIPPLPAVQLQPKLPPPSITLVRVPKFLERLMQPATSKIEVQTRQPIRPLTMPTRVPEHAAVINDAPPELAGGIDVSGVVPRMSLEQGPPIRVVPPKPAVQAEPATKLHPPAVNLEKTYRMGGDVKAPILKVAAKPAYPPLARQARVQGTVKLEGIVAKDGSVRSLKLLSGHPLLVSAALDAVRTWLYEPGRLNGQPVDVAITIDVNFTLAQ